MESVSLLEKICPHSWRYNFPSIPNKRICAFCKKKEALNLRTLQWNKTFVDRRTDKALIEKWFY